MIKYKGIRHNVLNDAPFIGALIIANSCSMGCKDCLNEHLKNDEYIIHSTAKKIIDNVKHNKLNDGVIFSGLEWTEQPDNLIKLVLESLSNQLEVIIYTHHNEDEFFKIVPELLNKPIYVKFGLYDENLKDNRNISCGVQLATSNQYIKYFG